MGKKPKILIEERADVLTRFEKGHKVPDEWKETIGGSTRFSKGKAPWNKGLKGYGKGRKVSQVTREKLREASTSREHTEETKQFISELHKGNKYWIGKKHTDEAKEKNSKATSERWKNPEYRKKILRARIGKQAGPLSSNWKGGISKQEYGLGWNKALKEEIRKRDNHTCKICGIKQDKLNKSLCVHHINEIKKDLRPKNLVSLCSKCHLKLHHNSISLFREVTSEKA